MVTHFFSHRRTRSMESINFFTSSFLLARVSALTLRDILGKGFSFDETPTITRQVLSGRQAGGWRYARRWRKSMTGWSSLVATPSQSRFRSGLDTKTLPNRSLPNELQFKQHSRRILTTNIVYFAFFPSVESGNAQHTKMDSGRRLSMFSKSFEHQKMSSKIWTTT